MRKKPDPVVYLKPFVEETIELYDEKLQWIDSDGIVQTSKVIFKQEIADAPARAVLTNMKKFDGQHSSCRGVCFT